MSIDEIIAQMRQSPHNVDFKDLKKVCKAKFGEPRQTADKLASESAIDDWKRN